MSNEIKVRPKNEIKIGTEPTNKPILISEVTKPELGVMYKMPGTNNEFFLKERNGKPHMVWSFNTTKKMLDNIGKMLPAVDIRPSGLTKEEYKDAIIRFVTDREIVEGFPLTIGELIDLERRYKGLETLMSKGDVRKADKKGTYPANYPDTFDLLLKDRHGNLILGYVDVRATFDTKHPYYNEIAYEQSKVIKEVLGKKVDKAYVFNYSMDGEKMKLIEVPVIVKLDVTNEQSLMLARLNLAKNRLNVIEEQVMKEFKEDARKLESKKKS